MDKKKLKSKMALFGDTGEKLAAAIGIAPQTLSLKMNERNGASFTKSEMEKIKVRYELTDDEFMHIFFAELVS